MQILEPNSDLWNPLAETICERVPLRYPMPMFCHIVTAQINSIKGNTIVSHAGMPCHQEAIVWDGGDVMLNYYFFLRGVEIVS